MTEIVSSARRVNELLASISTSSREQALGVEQTGRAVHELDDITQQNAAPVEQTAAAAAALRVRPSSWPRKWRASGCPEAPVRRSRLQSVARRQQSIALMT